MPIDARWTAVDVGPARSLIYGPRTGRLYLVDRAHASDPNLQRVLGLAPQAFDRMLEDPATSIAHDAGSLKAVTPPRVSTRRCIAYRLLDRSRHAVPFAAAVRLVTGVAARWRATVTAAPVTADAIGREVHALERRVGRADCYPRALATAFLALARGTPCTVSIGVLAPTRKMHAWCSIGGAVPFEPLPEHYLYRPLIVVSLAP